MEFRVIKTCATCPCPRCWADEGFSARKCHECVYGYCTKDADYDACAKALHDALAQGLVVQVPEIVLL